MLRVAFTLFGAFLCLLTCAQGTVRGKVTDKAGETLVGAAVVLKSDLGKGTTTDLDGKFSLTLDSPGPHVLLVRYVGYDSKEVSVNPKGGEVVVLNIILGESAVELEGVEVEGKARRSSDTYLDRMKANSAGSIDFISRDAMLRSGDNDAASAVKRVSGVSTVGAFVTVRGLADRYLVTNVNGARIPTLDPLTNNLRLDIFPTGLLDNVIITKTASPDLPGDWAGAYMSLNATDFPDRLQVSVGTGIGYNSNATFQDIISSRRSSTDWLGYDDGLRAIPDGVSPDVEEFPDFIEPDLYQQLSLLGLGGYLNGYGITPNTPGFQTTTMTTDNQLQHLALTELGLLGAALINNQQAVNNAVGEYNSTYNLAYFSPIVNAELADLNRRFNNENWRVIKQQGRPNSSLSLSVGNQLQLFKKAKEPSTLGFIIGFRYGTETEHDPKSLYQRNGEKYDDPVIGDAIGEEGTQAITVESSGWSAVGNLGFKLNRNNRFSLMIMPSRIGQNNARYLQFINPSLGGDQFISEEQFYEQRRLWVYQYGSKHLIPALNLTVEADASYSAGKRDMLDLRILQYVLLEDGSFGGEGQLTQPGRVYRFMDEFILDGRLGLEFPLAEPKPNLVRKLRFGGAFRRNQRENSQAFFAVRGAPDPDGWTVPGRFNMGVDGRFGSLYTPFGTFKDNDIGILDVWAGYLMTDYGLTPRLRLVAGARAEFTDMVSDIQRFYRDGIAPEDPIRGLVGELATGGASTAEPQPARPGTIERWDLLPSANLIYRLIDHETEPMNLRLAYFRSLARPSFREFSVVQLYDYQLRAFTFGNPNLQMVEVDNFDLRLERYFPRQNSLSLTGFYKTFRNHIELLRTGGGGFTWRNADRSVVYGVELEGRMRVAGPLELRGNLSWIYSRSDFIVREYNGSKRTFSTPMFGQAPWLANATLAYSPDSAGFMASVSYNVQGPRLAISTSEGATEAPRVFEMPRHLLDVTVSKKLGKHWTIMARGRNLLNAPVRRSYKFASGYDYDFDSFAWGTEYALNITYLIK